MHVPPKPDGRVIKDSDENGKAVFEIPPSGFGLGEVIIMSFAGVALVPILAALVLFVFQPEMLDLPRELFVMLMCLSVVPILLICFAVMSAARSERVALSAHDIRLDYLGRSKRIKTVAVIPTSEVEELELCKSTERREGKRVIAVRSDRVTIEFGGSLQSEEQEWLYARLWTVLTANQEKD
jgi:hypothetical protein